MKSDFRAWAIVWTLAFVAASFAGAVADLVGEVRAFSVYGALGIGLGWLWYRLFPRPLAERLLLPALFVPLGLAVALLPGTEIDQHVAATGMLPVGGIAGLVLAENRRNPRDWRDRETPLPPPERSRES
ncbi:MAG: hypothetical protein J7518_19200 [Nocardioidaceae bacterium]|nr:hypothetical protein [Nocardioidaceae bacterium]